MVCLLVSRCFAGDLPDSKLTPGAINPALTTDCCLCNKKWSTKSVRNTPQSEKEAVYKEYGVTHRDPGQYEIDHLISLELGGSNDIKNLWPQSYITKPWNAHVKDKLENYLHAQVCLGKVSLKTAQYEISHDWIAAYKKYLGMPK